MLSLSHSLPFSLWRFIFLPALSFSFLINVLSPHASFSRFLRPPQSLLLSLPHLSSKSSTSSLLLLCPDFHPSLYSFINIFFSLPYPLPILWPLIKMASTKSELGTELPNYNETIVSWASHAYLMNRRCWLLAWSWARRCYHTHTPGYQTDGQLSPRSNGMLPLHDLLGNTCCLKCSVLMHDTNQQFVELCTSLRSLLHIRVRKQ